MSLMVSCGKDLVRYNPSTKNIEISSNNGFSWFKQSGNSLIGNVRGITNCDGTLLLCSDKGVFCSTNQGFSWFLQDNNKSFTDVQYIGGEVIAMSSDGHVYASCDQGFYWFKRR